MKIYFFLQIIWSVQKKAVPLHSVSEMKLGNKIGAVVQLVRIHACHAWGRGFESRPHRKKKQKCFFFCYIVLIKQCFRYLPYIYRICTVYQPSSTKQREIGNGNKNTPTQMSRRAEYYQRNRLYSCFDIPNESTDTDFLIAFVEFLYCFEQ